MSKKAAKTEKTTTSENSQSTGSVFIIAAFILPFITWLIASLFNPTGWASDEPVMIFMLLALLVMEFWPVALLVVAIFVIACFVYRKSTVRNIGIFLLTVSVLYSAFLYYVVATADDSEFAA